MLHVHSFAFDLGFQYPFTITKGTKTHQETFVVALSTGRLVGFGEAPVISYYPETIATMHQTLQEYKEEIVKYALTDPKRFWHFLHHLLPEGNNFLTCALDMAAWDLFGQIRRQPIYELLGLKRGNMPVNDYTLGHDTIQKIKQKIAAHPARAYKIKILGMEDIELVRQIRAITDAELRIDGNEALGFEEARQFIEKASDLSVSLIEQPMVRGAWEEMKELKKISALPLIADESCMTEADVSRCAESFHGINIKLTKCGGITPALRMVAAARGLGLQLMIGSMCDSSIGAAACAQIAPAFDFADIDGPLLLTEDLATGLDLSAGKLWVSERPGLGVRIVPDHFRKPM